MAVRGLISAACPTDTELDKLLIDHFSSRHGSFGSQMSYDMIVNAMLVNLDPEQIVAAILEDGERKARCARQPQLVEQVSSELATVTAPLPANASAAHVRGEAKRGMLVQRPGGTYETSSYVERGRAEDRAIGYLSGAGYPTIVWGPSRFGKTWFTERLVAHWRKQNPGSRCVQVDLDLIEQEQLSSYPRFLSALALHISSAQPGVSYETRTDVSANHSFGNLVSSILAREESPLLLRFESADALLPFPECANFFRMLRAWSQDLRQPWNQLRILVSLSTTPSRLTDGLHGSPFYNLTIPIELSPLSSKQLQVMAAKHAVECSEQEAEALREWLGGHPFLSRILLYEVCLGDESLRELLHQRPSEFFEHHLSQVRRKVDQLGLRKAMTQVVKGDCYRMELDSYDALHRLGLIGRSADGDIALRGSIYAPLFR